MDHIAIVMMILVDLSEHERFFLGVSPPTTGLHRGYHMCTFEASWEKALHKVSEAWDRVGSRNAFEISYGPQKYHLNYGDLPGTTNVGDEASLLG